MTDGDSSNPETHRLGILRNSLSGDPGDPERLQDETLTVVERTADDFQRTVEDVSETETTGSPQTAVDVARGEGDDTGGDSNRIAQEYADIMRECANGDLTLRMSRTGQDDAMDRIAVNFNGMVTELEQTTGHLKYYVDEVEEAGHSIERSATTIRRASQEVVDSMQTISADMEGQQEQLAAASETMDAVATALKTVAERHPEADLQAQIDRLEQTAREVRDATKTSEGVQTESRVVSTATEAVSAELSEVENRASNLQRYANPLRTMLERFDTESGHRSVTGSESATAEEGQND